MTTSWTVSRILAVAGTVTLIAGGVGAMVATALNAAVPTWVFAAMFGVGVLDVIMSRVLKRFQGRRSPAAPGAPELPTSVAPVTPADPYAPSAEGVRLEQLKTITGLRDSGALTPAEYEAEKRRILKGDGV